jgi:hypothetical protein
MRTLRLSLLAALAALALALVFAQGAPARTSQAVEPDAGLVKSIRHYRRTTLTLQRVMGHRVRFHRLRRVSLRHAWSVWHRRAVATRVRFYRGPAHKYAWLCIHRYEGAWTDSGSPYYGGLQMDIGFQSSYGSALLSTKGTANNWTPLEQMWVAERAYRAGRGFYPWPNTARMCGLL